MATVGSELRSRQAHRLVDEVRQQEQMGHRGDDQEHAQVPSPEVT